MQCIFSIHSENYVYWCGISREALTVTNEYILTSTKKMWNVRYVKVIYVAYIVNKNAIRSRHFNGATKFSVVSGAEQAIGPINFVVTQVKLITEFGLIVVLQMAIVMH